MCLVKCTCYELTEPDLFGDFVAVAEHSDLLIIALRLLFKFWSGSPK